MKTDDEIIARLSDINGRDVFGWEASDLIVRLPFEKARPFLVDEAKAEEWEQKGRDRESVLAEMLDYMPFAWDKANGCRGISASRSMSHYAAWTWLLGDDFGDLHGYQFYGKDNLVKICERYGWDAKQWDDGRRVNSESEL